MDKREIKREIVNALSNWRGERIGPLEVSLLGKRDELWINNQKRALDEALQIINQGNERYRDLIYSNIKKIIFNNNCFRSLYRHFRLVVVDYRKDLTDNPVYLASLLVQHAEQMSQHRFIPLRIRQKRAVKKQLEFLSVTPDGKEMLHVVESQVYEKFN